MVQLSGAWRLEHRPEALQEDFEAISLLQRNCRDFSSASKSNIGRSASSNDLLPRSPVLGSMDLPMLSSIALTDLSTFIV